MEADAEAEFVSMLCDRSRKRISSLISSTEDALPWVEASSSLSCKYRTETSGSLKAAFIIILRTSPLASMSILLSLFVKIAARDGLVDHTREEEVGERGKNAMGPVGRKR